MEKQDGDGCSGGLSWTWRKAFGKPPPWENCCREHDEAYRKGGTAHQRLLADQELRRCVRIQCRATGYSEAWADLLYWSVRAGGGKYAPPLHWLAKPAVWMGLAESAPDYRWGRVP